MIVNCHYDDYGDFALEVAKYLYSEGVCQNPLSIQDEYAALPGIYIDHIEDTPTSAIMVSVVDDDRTEDDANPSILVLVKVRSGSFELMNRIMAHIFGLLHDQMRIHLTKTTTVLLSRRVLRTRGDQDENDRFQRVDSYEMRPLIRKA